MEQYLQMISVPSTTGIVYGIIALIKFAVKENEKFDRFVPLITCGLGIVLGIVAFYALPSIIPAHDIFTAIMIGASSGLSATGMNQIFKQLKKAPVIEPDVKDSKEIPISTADADSIDKKDS